MYSYDRDRHTWRYDVGGFTWDNSNLDPIRKIRNEPFEPKAEALGIALGTHFSALSAVWLTEWERTGDRKWPDSSRRRWRVSPSCPRDTSPPA